MRTIQTAAAAFHMIHHHIYKLINSIIDSPDVNTGGTNGRDHGGIVKERAYARSLLCIPNAALRFCHGGGVQTLPPPSGQIEGIADDQLDHGICPPFQVLGCAYPAQGSIPVSIIFSKTEKCKRDRPKG